VAVVLSTHARSLRATVSRCGVVALPAPRFERPLPVFFAGRQAGRTFFILLCFAHGLLNEWASRLTPCFNCSLFIHGDSKSEIWSYNAAAVKVRRGTVSRYVLMILMSPWEMIGADR